MPACWPGLSWVSSDNADNSDYSPQPNHNWDLTDGGYGYGPWTALGGASGGGTYMEGVGVNNRQTEGNYSFGVAAGSGSYAISRPLSNSITSGEFVILVRFDLAGSGTNRGMNLVSIRAGNNTNDFGTGELFSFGISPTNYIGNPPTGTPLCYNDGNGFHLLPSGEARGTVWGFYILFNVSEGTYSGYLGNVGGGYFVFISGTLKNNGTSVGSFAVINSSTGPNQNLVFDLPTFTVAVTNEMYLNVTNNGNGIVVKDPDQTFYYSNSLVRLTATPSPGWMFAGWTGDANGTNNPLTVVMTSDTTIMATFVKLQWGLTLTTNGSGEVTKDPDQPYYDFGSNVVLTAVPAPGWGFAGWSGDASDTNNPLTVMMNTSKTITANFYQPTLTTAVNGGGTILANPSQSPYSYNSTITLQAVPAVGWSFTSWSNDANGSENPVNLVMNVNKTVTANFAGTASACTPAPPGLVSWWPGAGNASDVIGTNNGTLTNGTTFVAAKVGQGFSFDGVDDAVVVSDSPTLNSGASDSFTFEMWLRVAGVSVAGEDAVLHKWIPGTAGYTLELVGTAAQHHLEFTIINGINGIKVYTGQMPAMGYHHVAVTLDRGSSLLSTYLDGVLQQSVDITGFPGLSNTSRLWIGHQTTDGSNAAQPLHGQIDELSLFNRALSASEVQAIYAAGSAGKCLTPVYITSVNKEGTNLDLSWLAQQGISYRVQYKTNLTDPAWLDLSGDVAAITNTARKTNVIPTDALQRFYRVRLLP